MKPFLLILLIAGLANAQDFGRGRGEGRGGGRGPQSFIRGLPLLIAIDTDHDGILSAKEIADAPAALRTLDKNNDGWLAPEELRPAFGEGRGGRGGRGGEGPTADNSGEMVQALMAFDKNGDGKIARSELPERMQGIFDRADTDKDGFLTPDEIRVVARAQTAAANPPEPLRLDPISALLDTNHDNVISPEEIANAPAILRSLDKNGDGQLTEDEVHVGPDRPREGR